ncbi:VOC family protein [Dyadobacter tibetensis]|uniref:VOC family protein n=1 Tax=Dyadobacter tibetensis TaxID=1211851 RepID=UPI0004B1D3F3|nr:VOC family protein [Dyadobacter tibetensis]
MEKMSPNTNSLNWFEIPVYNTKRAKLFYEAIFDIQMGTDNMMGMEMTFFPADMSMQNGKVSGALVKSDMHMPSADGSIIYLNANPSIQIVIDRIEKAGGKVLMPKTQISEDVGFMAFFADTEGNKVGLHAGG